MVLRSCSIQLPVVNANPPPGYRPSGNLFAIFTFDNLYPCLLWYRLSWADPRAIRNRIYYTCIQPL
ncbi:hypothetical protein HanXRQr2_Chr04g0143221 [Helianthus annuus]|uniref:Uncharacterized protein n=1 Tax=Helianthus annuus TaxID=4232 RepID=A0A9K3J4M1_HELAN|nr:hypothetical protein HanXRQr2_Chr04g0143221 [Helianthus annuus]KAJ0929580.1 hypothetical protein HanPSC8_Chr04g0139271 [Helianthus annuus]